MSGSARLSEIRRRRERRNPELDLVASDSSDAGFTLIELVLTSLILPIVVGAIVIALISIFTLQGGVKNMTSAAADAQTSTAFYEQDVHNAAFLTTSSTAAQCGTGTQLLGLEWNYNASLGAYQTVISYSRVPRGTTAQLVRNVCNAGASATPSSSMVVVSDLSLTQGPPTITPASSATAAAAGWVTTVGVQQVFFTIVEPTNGFSYVLNSVPKAGISVSLGGVSPSTSTSCGFASPGTGTYASSLCFVDFSSFAASSNSTGACPSALGTTNTCYYQPSNRSGSGCTTVTAGIAGTPYTLSFCLSAATTPTSGTSGGAWTAALGGIFGNCPTLNPAVGILPAPAPTYNAAPTSEAFLGNNGFYAGIPGNPVLYQCVEGSKTYIQVSNISLLDANGQSASTWQLVTGDGESSDPGESISWTSDKVLSDLPDSPTSPYGNACWSAGTLYLTGLNTTTVTCSNPVGGWSSNKTGTLMLTAPQPTSLNITLTGAGLEGIFIGVLLR